MPSRFPIGSCVVQFASARRRWLALCVVCLVMGACDTSALSALPDLTTRYEPLHPGNDVPVTFRMEAEGSQGIRLLELWVFEYELSEVEGNRVATVREGGQWGRVEEWAYPDFPKSVEESYKLPGFPAGSYVRYLVRATDIVESRRSEEWLFAAGDWPFGNSPIPILTNGPPGKRIDVCFVADRRDYEVGADMLEDLQGLIFDGYHASNAVREPNNDNRKYWQFYYSPETGFMGKQEQGVMVIPGSVGASAIIDHSAIIHTNPEIGDWEAKGNFGTEPHRFATALHESAHAVFDLEDEYPYYWHSTSTDPHHNMYNSEKAAVDYNVENGWDASEVEKVQDGWWRPEPESLECVMLKEIECTQEDDGEVCEFLDFARTCHARAMWFYSQL